MIMPCNYFLKFYSNSRLLPTSIKALSRLKSQILVNNTPPSHLQDAHFQNGEMVKLTQSERLLMR